MAALPVRRVPIPPRDVPGVPSATIDVPDHWELGHAPGVLLLAGDPTPEHAFRPNLAVSAAPVPAERTVWTLGDDLIDSLSHEHGTVVIQHRDLGVGEQGEHLLSQVVTFVPVGTDVEVVQLQSIVSEPRRAAVRTVFTLACSCADQDRPTAGALLRDLVETFRVDWPG